VDRYKPRSEWLQQNDTHTAFISDAEAEVLLAGAIPKARPKRAAWKFLLSGLLFTPTGEPFNSAGDNYYRAGKGRRLNADMVERAVLEQANEEADSHEMMDRFIHQAKKEAAAIRVSPDALLAELKDVEKKILAWTRMAERAPDSPTLLGKLVELEAERDRIQNAIRDVKRNSALKQYLENLTPSDARELIAIWEEDGASLEERRAALRQIAERIELDPNTGLAPIHYRIGMTGDRFKAATGIKVASPARFERALPP
jgi:hypothetical protein